MLIGLAATVCSATSLVCLMFYLDREGYVVFLIIISFVSSFVLATISCLTAYVFHIEETARRRLKRAADFGSDASTDQS